jgi:hypothetical protein
MSILKYAQGKKGTYVKEIRENKVLINRDWGPSNLHLL